MAVNKEDLISLVFQPSGKVAQPEGSQTLLQIARALSLPIQAPCGGKKKCGKCKVIIEASDGPLPLPGEWEQKTLGELITQGYRLACETVLTAGAHILIPDESLVQAPVILIADTGQALHLHLKPTVELFYAEVPDPDLNSVSADDHRLLATLQDTYGLRIGFVDYDVLKKLPQTLRSGKGVTALIRNKKEVIDLNPGRQEACFGMAFDIGTTTVVGYLFDLNNGQRLSVRSDLNPQIPFGDDVISRISFCREESEGLERLQKAMVQCLNRLIAEAAEEAGIHRQRIVEAVIVGNTVMHHLFLGLDPRYLALAPFPPVLKTYKEIKARDLGLGINPAGYVSLLPLKAAFVGSDIMAGVLASGIHKQEELTLFMDLGTNGEIVLGHKKRMVCCSTAAGPAFEGGHIRWGMRASKGAIEGVTIDPDSLAVSLKIIGDQAPAGICGSGIISALAEMIRRGIILARGNFNPAISSPRLRTGKDGLEFVLARADETVMKEDIVITRKDVAEVQMAKSAIYAGTVLLREFLGEKVIKRILLAGAFGNYVDPRDALTLGFFPEGETRDLRKVGNTAGYGACLALLNTHKRKEAGRIARKMEYLELAANPRFHEVFISGLFFRSASDYVDIF